MRTLSNAIAILFTLSVVGCAEPQEPTEFIFNEGDTYINVDNGEDEVPTPGDDDDSAEEVEEEVCEFELVLSDVSPYTATCEGSLMESSSVEQGDLFRATSFDMLYYQHEGARFAMPHGAVLESWYGQEACPVCEDVKQVPDAVVANIELGPSITIKPGSRIVVIGSDTQLFLVDECRTLRSTTPSVAREIYGEDWNELVTLIPDVFFTDYVIGFQAMEALEYDLVNAEAQTLEDELTCSNQPEVVPQLIVSIHPSSPSGASFPASMHVGLIFSITSIGADITLNTVDIGTSSTDNASTEWNRCGTWGAPGHFQLTEWLGNGSSLAGLTSYYDEFAQGCVSTVGDNGNVLGEVGFQNMNTTILDGETKTFSMNVATTFWLGGQWVSASPNYNDTVEFSVAALAWSSTSTTLTDLFGLPAIGGTQQY